MILKPWPRIFCFWSMFVAVLAVLVAKLDDDDDHYHNHEKHKNAYVDNNAQPETEGIVHHQGDTGSLSCSMQTLTIHLQTEVGGGRL